MKASEDPEVKLMIMTALAAGQVPPMQGDDRGDDYGRRLRSWARCISLAADALIEESGA